MKVETVSQNSDNELPPTIAIIECAHKISKHLTPSIFF